MMIAASSETWVALGTWATVLVAAAAAIAALWQVREVRRSREEEAQPYVVVFMEPSAATPQIVDLVVRNFGKTAAYDVKLEVVPAIKRSVQGGASEDVWLFDTLPVLVPGQEWRTMWDFGPSRFGSDLPDKYEVTVHCRSTKRKIPPLSFVLDWSAYKGRRWVSVYGLHDAAKSLRELERDVKKWQEGAGGGLKVYVRDGDAADRERARAFKEWKEERAETALRADPADESNADAPDGDEAK